MEARIEADKYPQGPQTSNPQRRTRRKSPHRSRQISTRPPNQQPPKADTTKKPASKPTNIHKAPKPATPKGGHDEKARIEADKYPQGPQTSNPQRRTRRKSPHRSRQISTRPPNQQPPKADTTKKPASKPTNIHKAPKPAVPRGGDPVMDLSSCPAIGCEATASDASPGMTARTLIPQPHQPRNQTNDIPLGPEGLVDFCAEGGAPGVAV